MMNIDKKKPVLVTGATGYVAGWIVKRLLEEGLNVHAAVRDPENEKKIRHLQEMAKKTKGKITFFKSDLMEDGSYAEAMKDCQVVFHTASPFTINVSDPQKDLVDPAKLGTRNVLEQAKKTPSVKRVVVTSSCAAIYGDNADLEKTPNGVFDETIWNTSSSLEHQPYCYSKTVAEQEAWKIADTQKKWDLVVINPSLVLGPGTNPFGTSESFNMIKQMGDGSMKAGVPKCGFGVVDVRDLAEAHLKAAFTPTASGRYVTSGHNTDLFDLATSLLEKYGDTYPIPRKALPKWLVWLAGPLANKVMTRKIISRNIDLPWRGDNSKSVKELGMTYRPYHESMADMFQQMIDTGQINAKK